METSVQKLTNAVALKGYEEIAQIQAAVAELQKAADGRQSAWQGDADQRLADFEQHLAEFESRLADQDQKLEDQKLDVDQKLETMAKRFVIAREDGTHYHLYVHLSKLRDNAQSTLDKDRLKTLSMIGNVEHAVGKIYGQESTF